ncbi:phosphatidylethanolamine-binding protein [Fomitopsis serialis]|uniref:phosphatidylethanolamine-binding protein n=1 Tax=Fomitopsis serialis TaxID=139415 RepID=UPI00200805F2|nr:phosphatidylethanolamine-binding protein [Neoantrodia serialis]KAH9923822.1 phosphatidylethanolamine-binding protein [Neoantrodia serialis]
MAHLDPLTALTTDLARAALIPDVLPSSFHPSVLLTITYPNSQEALPGNTLTVDAASEEPEIVFMPMSLGPEQADVIAPAPAGGLGSDAPMAEVAYTLAMVDPDAPSRVDPQFRCFRHWLITGLKAPPRTASRTASPYALKTEPATTPYRPPGPRPASGIHRYTFLLWQEPSTAQTLRLPAGAPEYGAALEERRSWDPVVFAEKYGLKLVGATYFLVEAPPTEEA